MQSAVLYTVIRFVATSAKFGTCAVMSVNGTLFEDTMRRFNGKCTHFSFNKCPFTLTMVQMSNLALTHTTRGNSVLWPKLGFSFNF
jgi:hypothetical protein